MDKKQEQILNERAMEVLEMYPMPMMSFTTAPGPTHDIKSLLGLRNYSFPGVAIDIGANVGAFSIVVAQHFDKIMAYEPVKKTYKTLKSNLERFNLHNVETYNLAVGKKDKEKVRLFVPEDDAYSGDASAFYEVHSNGHYEEVETICLESILEKIEGAPYIHLKVDCEGAEYNFLLDKDLSRIDSLSIELHGDLTKQKKIAEHLDKYFYLERACPDLVNFFAVRKVMNKNYPHVPPKRAFWKKGQDLIDYKKPFGVTFAQAVERKERK